MDGLPVFEALIGDDNCGIYRISLVDLPAVESNFLAFGKNEKAEKQRKMMFNVDDEEKHMVTGVIMRADYNIYRYDPSFGEYYIRYSPETIRVMAEKMMSDNTFNNINLQHVDGTDVEGVNLVEIFIKDTAKGINPAGFENIENGSLFATYKVNNEEIWEQIKAGSFLGFSLEGIFDLEMTKHNKKNSIMNRLFNRFLKSFVKCGSMMTEDGKELFWVGEADLQIGDELFYNTENEEAVKVEDGEYRLSDGTTIVVSEGLVKEIREADGEREDSLDNEIEAEKEDEKDGKKVECEEEIVVEPVEEPAVEEDKPSYDELKADIDQLRREHDELRGLYEDLKNTVDAVLNKPVAEPIVEEFEKNVKQVNGIPEFGSRSRLHRN